MCAGLVFVGGELWVWSVCIFGAGRGRGECVHAPKRACNNSLLMPNHMHMPGNDSAAYLSLTISRVWKKTQEHQVHVHQYQNRQHMPSLSLDSHFLHAYMQDDRVITLCMTKCARPKMYGQVCMTEHTILSLRD